MPDVTEPHTADGGAAPAIDRLVLANFRSYAALDLDVDGRMVALVGENGAGKTNILEAISLFSQGRGLRRAELGEMARVPGDGTFSVSVRLAGTGRRLGTGTERADGEGLARRCRIDGAPASSPAAFADHLRLVWLTPALDGLFTGPAGDRRRFLDRLVLAVDATHGTRVNALERALRSRNRLLEDERADPRWLDAVEREVAETGVAVAAARREAVERLSALVAAGREGASPFPWAAVALDGALEAELATRSAIDVEDLFRDWLRAGRARDRAAGRTLTGPQTSDLTVRHGPKNVAAAQASTGEQKALLVGIVLAHARLVAAMTGTGPIVLLDEVAAHLDPRRRGALFAILSDLGVQVWMTGADPAAFAALPAGSRTFEVTPGRVAPIRGA
ncbi:DNA replication/repair protein RecF [Alsobacter sp. R-9]